jgi:hypothetical protein
MTTPIRTFKYRTEKLDLIARRIVNNTRGLGFWSAIDAFKNHLDRLEQNIVLDQIKDKEVRKYLVRMQLIQATVNVWKRR